MEALWKTTTFPSDKNVSERLRLNEAVIFPSSHYYLLFGHFSHFVITPTQGLSFHSLVGGKVVDGERRKRRWWESVVEELKWIEIYWERGKRCRWNWAILPSRREHRTRQKQMCCIKCSHFFCLDISSINLHFFAHCLKSRPQTKARRSLDIKCNQTFLKKWEKLLLAALSKIRRFVRWKGVLSHLDGIMKN